MKLTTKTIFNDFIYRTLNMDNQCSFQLSLLGWDREMHGMAIIKQISATCDYLSKLRFTIQARAMGYTLLF
jgi:hypothetical protein